MSQTTQWMRGAKTFSHCQRGLHRRDQLPRLRRCLELASSATRCADSSVQGGGYNKFKGDPFRSRKGFFMMQAMKKKASK